MLIEENLGSVGKNKEENFAHNSVRYNHMYYFGVWGVTPFGQAWVHTSVHLMTGLACSIHSARVCLPSSPWVPWVVARGLEIPSKVHVV